jgi:hypothetical protein
MELWCALLGLVFGVSGCIRGIFEGLRDSGTWSLSYGASAVLSDNTLKVRTNPGFLFVIPV